MQFPFYSMVGDAFGPAFMDFEHNTAQPEVEKEPLQEYKGFFEMLKNAETPLYDCCKGSLLSVAARVMKIKYDYNLPLRAVDNLIDLVKDILLDENVMTKSYYDTKKVL